MIQVRRNWNALSVVLWEDFLSWDICIWFPFVVSWFEIVPSNARKQFSYGSVLVFLWYVRSMAYYVIYWKFLGGIFIFLIVVFQAVFFGLCRSVVYSRLSVVHWLRNTRGIIGRVCFCLLFGCQLNTGGVLAFVFFCCGVVAYHVSYRYGNFLSCCKPSPHLGAIASRFRKTFSTDSSGRLMTTSLEKI